ncbi:MAG: triphosphoribosyl-dephospho-CoA synthase [Gammaproteobacteria bacterium]|nr:triphosphoribosyl-dephospho-CoA synthase [Gammaproteobacteria bacterium]
MNPVSIKELQRLYRVACAQDVIAFKPGNVSYASPGHGMDADTFRRSAQASAQPLTEPGLALGERVLAAVVATRAAVACNSNLGILLLCAPLVQATINYPDKPLHEGVRRVLRNTSVADSLAVYEAIRIAAPGGLGEVDEHDVSLGTRLTLTDVMSYAAPRDLIAAQYVNAYADLFDTALPFLDGALRRCRTGADAVTALFLFLLSRYPDTHITRKFGADSARKVSQTAGDVRAAWDDATQPGEALRHLIAFDKQLKSAGLNPGTTADLCVATLFSHHLRQQVDLKPGDTRNHPWSRHPTSVNGSTHVD